MKKQILEKEHWMLLNRIVFRNLKSFTDDEVYKEILEVSKQHKSKNYSYTIFNYLNREDVGKIIYILDNLKTNNYSDFDELLKERIKINRRDINEKG